MCPSGSWFVSDFHFLRKKKNWAAGQLVRAKDSLFFKSLQRLDVGRENITTRCSENWDGGREDGFLCVLPLAFSSLVNEKKRQVGESFLLAIQRRTCVRWHHTDSKVRQTTLKKREQRGGWWARIGWHLCRLWPLALAAEVASLVTYSLCPHPTPPIPCSVLVTGPLGLCSVPLGFKATFLSFYYPWYLLSPSDTLLGWCQLAVG